MLCPAWLAHVLAVGVIIGASLPCVAAVTQKMSRLSDEHTVLGVSVPTKELDDEQMALLDKAIWEKLRIDGYSPPPGSIVLQVFLDQIDVAEKILSTVAAVPKNQWRFEIIVYPAVEPDPEKREEERMRRAAGGNRIVEAPPQLKLTVKPHKKATVGDALQTIADTLDLYPHISAAVVKAEKNDWRALLDLPLVLREGDWTDGLTVGELIDVVADSIGATVHIDYRFGFVEFEPSREDAEEGEADENTEPEAEKTRTEETASTSLDG